ncbi:hypothetical protein H6S82_04830 [Planktothrix sp. FACHB-1355]|uniref:Uncharacterized protein n=1 Tax=Aerosakkonema funiforme FACHB-1375 TaxID=2949571 RepID=A0A926VJ48_9CYAN|nr:MULTISPECIES: hypothetical protein [Oscillatoriales]MBD2183464.1 hypothetical protein [Aerosakkonema funiforme FACHB-1375]MBD3558179.1 hypothetical protein [Planktothrix sp. FACHB-1355]
MIISEGISTGLKAALFFFLGFLLLGQSPALSFLLAILGGLSAGWIAAGWKNTETPSLPQQTTPESAKEGNPKPTKTNLRRKKINKRHQPRPSWFFWKNPRRSSRL